jgi:hypothetical protein
MAAWALCRRRAVREISSAGWAPQHLLEIGEFVAQIGRSRVVGQFAPKERRQFGAEMILIRLRGQIRQQRTRLGRAKVRDRAVVQRDREATQ